MKSPDISHSKPVAPLNVQDLTTLDERGPYYPIMIEYRGNFPQFRTEEFYESLYYVSGGDYQFVEEIKASSSIIIPDKSVMEEKLYDASMAPPLCMRVQGPLDLIKSAAQRCSLLRSASIIWGDGESPEEAALDSDRNFEAIVAPSFAIRHESKMNHLNDWRVNFRRYGRSKGWTNPEKINLLGKFNPLLRSLKGNVDLKDAAHDLIYLEDWHDFHWEVTLQRDQMVKRDGLGAKASSDEHDDDDDGYTPHRAILGEIFEEPIKVESTFCLADRPFLGTTTMSALPAHLAAVAACVGRGDRVLDPFCGTGSLLLSCAYLQADVVGSDIDATCLGLGVHHNHINASASDADGRKEAQLPEIAGGPTKFKNQNFKRHGNRAGLDQSGMSTVTNFHYYGLEERLEALLACDIQTWVESPLSAEGALPCVGSLRRGELFDAICCDPPYSKREKAATSATTAIASGGGGTESEDQDDPEAAFNVLSTLFSLAGKAVKAGGRLVFWYPSRAFVTEGEIRQELDMLMQSCDIGDGEQRSLRWRSATPEKMHDKLWRWLVVLDVL